MSNKRNRQRAAAKRRKREKELDIGAQTKSDKFLKSLGKGSRLLAVPPGAAPLIRAGQRLKKNRQEKQNLPPIPKIDIPAQHSEMAGVLDKKPLEPLAGSPMIDAPSLDYLPEERELGISQKSFKKGGSLKKGFLGKGAGAALRGF